MKQYRGVARRVAGFVVIFLAVDMAAIALLGTRAPSKFTKVGEPVTEIETEEGWKPYVILVAGCAIGVVLYAWGDAAGRKQREENKDAI
jgi:hypothetical protein